MSLRLERGICAALCAGGGQFHERRKRLGGRPHMEIQSHILDEIKDDEGRRGEDGDRKCEKTNETLSENCNHNTHKKGSHMTETKSSLLMWTY